ncbi:MAG TPA: hypothetical protein VHD76_14500 [Bryobacteraceae bacterium]|nr:hypothetical protein [Bryobacteraceae bacterium]
MKGVQVFLGLPSRPAVRRGIWVAAAALAVLVTPSRAQFFSDDRPDPGPQLPDGNFRGLRSVERPLIFFPPIPPQLGASINPLGESQGRYPAPAELASYVGEPFYAPLSTRLSKHSLRPKIQLRLDAYRNARLALLTELRAKLAALQNADPLTRERELAAFAKVQTPRVAALEKSGEEIRADLVAGGFFEDSADWNDQRDWHLGVSGFRTQTQAMLAQYQVMRAAVFYVPGLSPAQRRLLHEVAMELAEIAGQLIETGENGPPPKASADSNPLFYFSPETSRIRLPTELPPELARKISDYEREKSALKNGLRLKVYAEDRANFDFLRSRAFAALDDEQEPRLAALESLAEEIRRGLAQITGYAQPPALPRVPPAVIAELTELVHAKRTAQQSAVVLVRDIKSVISVSRVDATRGPEGRAKLSVMVNPQDRTEAKLKPVREMVARYNQENAVRIAAMEKDKAAIQEQLAQFVGAHDPGEDGVDAEKAVKDLMDDAYNTIERREEWTRYRDYRAAVLEPGLSPEQRRLLYSAGLEALELPLPAADRPVGFRWQ